MIGRFLVMSLLFTGMIFLPAGDVYTSQNNSVLEQRIEQLRDELDNLSSLLEKQKREYIKQHPIEIKPSVEPNVMWELAKETEGKQSYQYLEEYVKYFPDNPKVQNALWYMMSMANSEEIDKDPFILLDEYANQFSTDEVNIRFARACLYYHKVESRFWVIDVTQEQIRDSKEDILQGIIFFKKAMALARPKDRFKGFKSPTSSHWSTLFYDWGDIRESARWNIAQGYEKLRMWQEAIEAYSIYVSEFPKSDNIAKAKAKIYLFRQKSQK